ncbi:hypothetical protein CBM2637_A250090 [Cupriavidus taiwanensis]|nr:hypothetical protein CBM2637_A250090 [Cupriavidus taiwanensis]
MGRGRARHCLPPGPRRRVPGRRGRGHQVRQGAGRAPAELPGRHPAAERQARAGPGNAGGEPALRRRRAGRRAYRPAGRADQHLRHPGLLPVAHAAGAGPDHPGQRAQPVRAVRHLSHAADGRRDRQHHQGQPAEDQAHPAGRQPGPQRAGHGRTELPVPVQVSGRDRLHRLDRLRIQAEDHHRSRPGLARRARRAISAAPPSYPATTYANQDTFNLKQGDITWQPLATSASSAWASWAHRWRATCAPPATRCSCMTSTRPRRRWSMQA